MPGFRRRGPEIDLDVSAAEAELLALALPLLAAAPPPSVGEAPRCYPHFRAHPGDEEAESRFRELTAGSLEAARTADRRRYAVSLSRGTLSGDDAAAWLRVLAEARLALAARLDVAGAGEAEAEPDPGVTLLQLFGCVQDELAVTLLQP